MSLRLSTTDHNRDAAGLTYVYPVISRRAGGLSVGINFNTNNACNWRCIYCQVPDLVRGAAPPPDFVVLEQELRDFLDQVLLGDFYDRFDVPDSQRVIKDIAISGNGEPTSLPDFADAIQLIGDVAVEKGIFPQSRFVLISNGSLMHQPKVQAGLRQLNRYGGEVWFKLDRATREGRKKINHSMESDARVLEHLKICAGLCRTKLQTCLFDYRCHPWTEEEKLAYLQWLREIKNQVKLEEILLYSIARESRQPEAKELTKLPANLINEFAEQIREVGFCVSVNV